MPATLALVIHADLAPMDTTVHPRLRHELDERLPAVFGAAEAALDDGLAE